jgi:hypothetical protein
MNIHRPTVFWLFVLGFFVAVASVLFYTSGYRFSFTRGIFVYTGSLTIDSNPDLISIKIDGETVPDNRLGILNKASHIAGLAPGEYQVEVTSPGYQTWQKKVIVESGRSTEFWNVLLARDPAVPIILPNTPLTTRAYPAPKRNLVALASKDGAELKVSVYNTKNESSVQVFSLPDADLLDAQSDGIEWSPEAEKILIPLVHQGVREYYLVDVATTDSTKLAIFTDDTKRKFTRFHPKERATIIYLDKQTLTRVDTREDVLTPIPMYRDIIAYDISSERAYTLTNNGIIMRYPLDSNNYATTEGIQITTSPITVSLDNEYFVVIYDESRISLLEPKSGTFWLFNKEVSPDMVEMATGIKGTQFSDDGKKLLYYSNTDISVAYLADWEVQPARTQGTSQQIIRLSSPITGVQWAKDYEHVIYALGGNVMFAELDSRDYRNIGTLISLPVAPLQVYTRFEEDRVYIIQNSEGEDRLTALDFPEAPTLFGFGR